MQSTSGCTNCGAEATPRAAFCAACGHRLDVVSDPSPGSDGGERAHEERLAASTATPAGRTTVALPAIAPSAAVGAALALATSIFGMAVLSAILVGSAKFAVALVGGSLGASVQLSLTGILGGDLGSLFDASRPAVFLHFPLTTAAVIPAAALLAGGWVAAGRLAGRHEITAGTAAKVGACSGVLFAPLLLFANLLAGGGLQSRPLPTLVCGLLWGVALGSLGALCRQTRWHPVAELRLLAAPLRRLAVLSTVPELAVASARIARGTLAVLGVYAVVWLTLGAFDESIPAGLAMVVIVAVTLLGPQLLRRLGGSPQASFGLLAAAVVCALIVLSVRSLRLFVLGVVALLPAIALAAIYWAQGASFEIALDTSSTSADYGRIAFWSALSDSWVVTLFALPIAVIVAWHLFHAGHRIAVREQPADLRGALLHGAALALPWTALMLLLRPLVTFSTGGQVLFGEVVVDAGPTALSVAISALLFASLFGAWGAAHAFRTQAAAVATPRIFRWAGSLARAPLVYAYLVRDVTALARASSSRPGMPGAAAGATVAPDAAAGEPAQRITAQRTLWSEQTAPPEDAMPATPAVGAPAGEARADRPAPIEARPEFRWRRRHTAAAVAVAALGAAGIAANGAVQAKKDRDAVAAAVDESLTSLRHAGNIAATLNATRVLPVTSEQDVKLRRYDDIVITRLRDHEATATISTLTTLRTSLHERYRAAPKEIQISSVWRMTLVGSKDERRWEVRGVTRAGAFTTKPPTVARPARPDIDAAQRVAEEAAAAAFSVRAGEKPASYNARQPDVYLTAPVSEDEALRLIDSDPFGFDDDVRAVPPFLVTKRDDATSERSLVGAAYEAARDALLAESELCFGDASMRSARATLDGSRANATEVAPLADLQRVVVSGTLRVRGQTSCRSEAFFSDRVTVERSTVRSDTPIEVTLVRPQIEGLDADWRVEKVALGEFGGNTVYAAQP